MLQSSKLVGNCSFIYRRLKIEVVGSQIGIETFLSLVRAVNQEMCHTSKKETNFWTRSTGTCENNNQKSLSLHATLNQNSTPNLLLF